MSRLTVHTVISGLVSVVTLFWVDRTYRRFPIRPVLIVNLLVYHLAYMAMSLFSETWQWCAASVFTGISGAFLLYVPVPLLLNNWFIKKKKLALSICFVASGASGILTNMLLGYVIRSLGWRAGYVIRGALLLLPVIPVILLVRKEPAEMGLLPYGAGDQYEEDQKVMGESAERFSFGQKRFRLICCVILAIAFNLGCAMVTQLPNYAASMNMGIVMGAMLTSVSMAGNIASKAAMGPAVEKFGTVTAGAAVVFCVTAGYLFLSTGVTGTAAVAAASFTTGFTACTNTLIVPNLLDTFARGDDYVYMLSRCSMGTMLAGAFSNVIASGLYDLFGNYRPVFLIYAMLEIAGAVLLVSVFGLRRRKESL